MEITAEKQDCRKAVRAGLKAAAPMELAQQSAAICALLLKLPQYASAKSVVAYLHCPKLREVDVQLAVDSALERDAEVFVPVVKDKSSNMVMLHLDSLSGLREVPPFGILEPAPQYASGHDRRQLIRDGIVPDVVVLPGLAFDRAGNRLGRGGGYYDKFLESLAGLAADQGATMPVLVGACFREQLLDRVPIAPHDRRCDWLVTPDETIRCTGN